MENDLISRNELKKALKRWAEIYRDDITVNAFVGLGVAAGELRKAPGIDAAPVVRCRECKHRCTLVCPMYHTETCLDDLDGFDDYNVDRTDNDGFCHLGARMDAEEKPDAD